MNSKNAFHDLKSSLTAIQLGVRMLSQLPEIQALNSEEVNSTISKILEKADNGIQQAKHLSKELS